MRWRSFGTLRFASRATFQFATNTLPLVGLSSRSSSRSSVDLPDPEGPMRKTNSPGSTSIDTSSSAGRTDVG